MDFDAPLTFQKQRRIAIVAATTNRQDGEDDPIGGGVDGADGAVEGEAGRCRLYGHMVSCSGDGGSAESLSGLLVKF